MNGPFHEHSVILPVLLPVFTATLLLLLPGLSRNGQRRLSLASAAFSLLLAAYLLARTAAGDVMVYRIGNWPAAYGIALLADRLAAMMLMLTGLLAFAALLRAAAGDDDVDPRFHVFGQMLMAGVSLAFLTNDLFNLFVAFEVLLLASYALAVAGGGRERLRAGIAYVVLNLIGSSLFLVGLALLYGALGTLNMADAAQVLAGLPAENVPLARLAFMLIVLVFMLKAALLPMSFWLPHVYGVAPVASAMLFAVLTKVGIYALIRVATLILPAHPATAGLLTPWLGWLALGTIVAGAIGVLSARRLSVLVAHLVLISGGTLLFAAASPSERALAALSYYLPQSTLVTGAFFLVAGMLAERRGAQGDQLRGAPPFVHALPIGLGFAFLAVAASGLPPLSGFFGKVMLMRAFPAEQSGAIYWAVLLLAGFVVALMLARVGGVIFWDVVPGETHPPPHCATAPSLAALAILIGGVLALTFLARPVAGFTGDMARQLLAREATIAAVLGAGTETMRERRP